MNATLSPTMSSSLDGGEHPDDRYAPTSDGRRICHRVEGDDDGPVVVLLAGLLQDLLSWPDDFLDALVEQGFRVIRVDNRDVGRSTPSDRQAPSLWRQLAARPRPDAYTLEEMADDVVAVLDHVGVPTAHVVGVSMGAMIAQCVATGHPDRVLSLTSLWSSTGARGVGAMAPSTRRLMVQPPPRTRGESVVRHVQFIRHIAGGRFGLDAAAERILGCEVWDRALAHGPEGALRQIQAIQASGDRSESLSRIITPTLVVHGDRDLVVDLSGGRATAAAVPGARLVEVRRMGHHLAPGLVEPLARLIGDHMRAAEVIRRGRVPELADLPSLLAPTEEALTEPAPVALRTWAARAVVTGAGSGIGREIAVELGARRGRVVCADVNLVAADETARMVREAGGQAIAVAVDVTVEESMRRLADTCVEWFGPPTLVVNNAGVATAAHRVGETPMETWRHATRVNLWGVVLGCEIFTPLLRRTGGPRGIINVASAASFTASPRMGAYSVGKAGALALSETLAAEFADGHPANAELAVSVVCPTFVETDIFDGELMDAASAQYARRRAAEIGTTAADVARTALDEHDRGTLYVFPSHDARRYWRLKRLLPGAYPRLAANTRPSGESMTELDSARPRTVRTPRSPRPVTLPGPVQPRQSLGALLTGPIVLGVLAGLALGWTGPAYWMLQVIAVLLTPVGVVKVGARAAFGPAVLGGLAFGVSILVVRAVTGWPDATALTMEPMFLPLVTAAVGGALGALGGAHNARRG